MAISRIGHFGMFLMRKIRVIWHLRRMDISPCLVLDFSWLSKGPPRHLQTVAAFLVYIQTCDQKRLAQWDLFRFAISVIWSGQSQILLDGPPPSGRCVRGMHHLFFRFPFTRRWKQSISALECVLLCCFVEKRRIPVTHSLLSKSYRINCGLNHVGPSSKQPNRCRKSIYLLAGTIPVWNSYCHGN